MSISWQLSLGSDNLPREGVARIGQLFTGKGNLSRKGVARAKSSDPGRHLVGHLVALVGYLVTSVGHLVALVGHLVTPQGIS